MIGLAVLSYIASKIDGLSVGTNCFYEDLPINYRTGIMHKYGVYVTTESAPLTRTSDDTQLLSFYVVIGGDVLDSDGNIVPNKKETDRIVDLILQTVRDSDADFENLKELTLDGVSDKYVDVRLEPNASKQRDITLPNGAIVKNVVAQVYYKTERE